MANDQLDAFRKRLRGDEAAKSKRLPFKEATSLIFASFAFVISAISFYFNTFRQIDELRILIDAPPHVSLLGSGEPKGAKIVVEPRLSAFFMNSGERSVSILSIFVMLLEQDFEKESAKCIWGRRMNTSVEPFVLKEHEAKRIKLLLDEGPNGGRRQLVGLDLSAAKRENPKRKTLKHENQEEENINQQTFAIEFEPPDNFEPGDEYEGILCLVVDWATPSDSGSVGIRMTKYQSKDYQLTYYVGPEKGPTVVVRKVRTIFSQD
jgi:hypothetical protein